MKRRKAAFIILTALISLLAACMPWQEDNKDVLSVNDSSRVRLLFEDLTDTLFMDYLVENADLMLSGSTVKATLLLENYGDANATGEIHLSFHGTLSEELLVCDGYTMQGTAETNGSLIEIMDATGKTDGLEFTISSGDIIPSTPSRIRYPSGGTIQIDGKDGQLVMLFPETPPFITEPELSEEEIETVKMLIHKAFQVFPIMEEGVDTKSFSEGTAVLEAYSNENWSLQIRAEENETAITIKIFSNERLANVIYGHESIDIDKDILLKGMVIPVFKSNSEEQLAREYLEILRKSNLVFALRGLINGSSSGVITLSSLEEKNNAFTVSLLLSGYGLKNGMKVTGELELTLSGKRNGTSIEAGMYSADSQSLTFSGLEEPLTLSVENTEGRLEGEMPCFILNKTGEEYKATYTGDLILGIPHKGTIETENTVIHF